MSQSTRGPARHIFCSDCGSKHVAFNTNPLSCACGADTYFNPKPVAVIVAPVASGVICVRRAIPPRVGELALPGGFLMVGEDWREGATREMREETGMTYSPEEVVLFTPPGFSGLFSVMGGNLLIFVRFPRRRLADVPFDHKDDEIKGIEVISSPVELAFPTHSVALRHALFNGAQW